MEDAQIVFILKEEHRCGTNPVGAEAANLIERLKDRLKWFEMAGGVATATRVHQEISRADRVEAENAGLKTLRDAVVAENGRLVVENERLKAALLQWQLGEGDTEAEVRANRAETDLSIARAHERTLCDTLDSEIAKWQEAEACADRAEAVIVELRAWLLKLLCGENTARDAAIAADDLVVTRVRQGRINLIEDAADELDALCRKHHVTLEEMK